MMAEAMAVLVISYSRADQAQVRALVSLLRGGLRGVEKAVYWDEQFEPGEPWFEQLKFHIDSAPQLFVFWCDHSSSSEQVRREFTYALGQNKRVVPVLLDDTPLSAELAPIHGIDLRGAVRHGDGPPPTRSRFAGKLLAVAATLTLLASGAAWWTLRDPVASDGQSSSSSTGASPPPFDSGTGGNPVPSGAPPSPARIVIEGGAGTSSPDGLSDAARARVDALARSIDTAGTSRIVIRARPGRDVDAGATRLRSEELKRYIARTHALALDRIVVETVASAPIGGRATAGAPADEPAAGTTLVLLQPRVTPGTEPVAGPDPVTDPVTEPGTMPSRPSWTGMSLLLVAGAVALGVFAVIRRTWRERQRRRRIVRQFERHLADTPS
jgi:hypothetical protein